MMDVLSDGDDGCIACGVPELCPMQSVRWRLEKDFILTRPRELERS